MSLGALIVGASKYSYTREHFADAPEHLKYSVVDAKAIEQYLETCWFKEQRNIQTFFDEEVTEKKLEEGFAALKEAGPFEHLFIFLSGHGVAHSETLGFLLQPHLGMPEKLCVLSALKLNALLSDCRAKQVILILDCCFAGAIASKLNYFLELEPNDNGRLFIASSRADQVTWEDERVGHGIFTAHLLDLLNTGDAEALEKTRDFLDVDSELFPILCEQVPLYTIKAKGAKQEPLKGGSSASPIYLPTVNAIRSLKSNTIYSAVTRKFRQFVFTASSVLLIAMISAYFFVYHIEPNERGNLVVKNGPRWLEPVFKYFPSVRTETRLNVSQLSLNPVQARDIQSGYASGVWLHKNERGYRGWVDDIVEGLEPLS